MAIGRPSVVYWNNIPSPYMVERFNSLVARNNLDFEAWFNDRVELGRSWDIDEATWQFPYRYVPTTRIAAHILHWPWPLCRYRPDILVSLYAQPVFLAGWCIAKLCGVKTGLWVEVTSDRWVWIKRSRVKEMIKEWLFPKVDAIITVGANGRDFALRYGASAENIYYAPHAIDVIHYQSGARAAVANRESLRKKLGLRGVTFIYVGRLWYGKGLVYMAEAFKIAQERSDQQMSLLLVGDGPEEASLRKRCIEHGIRNVVFVGFQQKIDLPRYYAAADIFVFPTLGDTYGLVIDEAMACGLPVISTNAVGEIHDRIEDGVNGYIVPPRNSEAMAERMLKLMNDGSLRQRMGEYSEAKIQDHTPERWAEDFERIIDSLLSGRSRKC